MIPINLRLARQKSFADGGALTKLLFPWITFFVSCQDFCALSSNFEDIRDEQLVIATENGTENNYSQQVYLICCNKKIFCALNV